MRFSLKTALVLAAFCGPKTVLAHDAYMQSLCERKLLFQSQAEEKLGYLPVLRSERMKPFSKAEGVERHMIHAYHPRFGTEIAFLDYSLFDGGRTIEVEKVDVLNANNFNKGVSKILFAEMLQARPQADKMIVRLGLMNLSAILKALPESASCLEAFTHTPFYKAAAPFGFTKITADCNPVTSEYGFVLERESAH